MFGAVFLVCGITNLNPMAIDGCGLITSKVPFRTEEECVDRLDKDTELIEAQLKDGLYIADKKCYRVNKEI